MKGTRRFVGPGVISPSTATYRESALLAAFDPQIVFYPAIVLLDDGVIFAQRESFPLFGQKDAAHIGMARELDAEHVEHLALEPVGAGVDVHRGLLLCAIRAHGLHAHTLIAREAGQAVDQSEAL